MTLIRLVFFQSGGLRLALDLREVQRVVPVPLLHPAAGAPDFIEGFFDYQGRAVAALRLGRLIGGSEDALGLYAPLIVLTGRDPATALHVARVDGVLKADPETIRPIDRDATFNGCVIGRLTRTEETIYLIRADAILLSAERARLAIFAALQQARLNALPEASHAA